MFFFTTARRLESIWILQDVHYMSTLLHPSLKLFQIAPHEKAKAIELVKVELLKRQSSTSCETSLSNTPSSSSSKTSTTSKSESVTPTTRNILLQCFDAPAEEDPLLVLSCDKELEHYLHSNATIGPEDDVLHFWKQNESIYPTLASIVKDIYSIPASNTTVERLFSTAGSTISSRRTDLNMDKVNQLLFLNKNLLPLREIDQTQLLYTNEKRKISEVIFPLSPSIMNNIVVDDDEDNELYSTISKKARTFDDDDDDDRFIDVEDEDIDKNAQE